MENTDDSLTTSIAIEEKNQLDRSADVVSPSNSDEENSNDKTYVHDNSSSDTDDSYIDTVSMTPETRDLVNEQCDVNLPEKRVRRKPDYYKCANMCIEMPSDYFPLRDAMSEPDKEQWQCAMKEELKSFEDNDTWELVDRRVKYTVVKNKWVFKKSLTVKVKCDLGQGSLKKALLRKKD
ncbi:hypothetical protein EVAR_10003_1 [Eumeta japonica]|uniref:Retrovirus-related Pol polyprotein from transposon TNT 1-94 n=1 Tax=Eumeta variegata TaxID=151549 RepID=A0A4C1TR07_EUMVA|nr:hypothetical protein EVAR_10003_1 [Eumeta japonica]